MTELKLGDRVRVVVTVEGQIDYINRWGDYFEIGDEGFREGDITSIEVLPA